MAQDLFQSPDYFNVDELLTEEHKLIGKVFAIM